MSPWAAHFASGNVLFSGVALLVVAAIAAWKPSRRPSRRFRRLGVLVAAVLIAASATPLPWPVYAAWSAAVLALFLLDRESDQPRVTRSKRAAIMATLLFCVLTAGWELATQLPVSHQGRRFETVYVIGDSVSAGMGDPPHAVWPAVMGRKFNVRVVNLAREGATVRSALRQAEHVEHAECLVILEIGGNDMLSGRPGGQFDVDLKRLLDAVDGPGRRIVLMELPLPPLCNEYGRVQRRRAREYGAALVSKRVFADVLSTRDATVDGVHLSPGGHQLMADRIWKQIEACVAESTSDAAARR